MLSRYVVEPYLAPSSHRYQAQSVIAESLSTTLKASISLVTDESSPRNEAHLHDSYGYSM
jgi:hypothetical protein